MQKKNDYTISSVQKALKVLKLFNTENQDLTLTEISILSGHNKSSVLRILATLEKENFIKYNKETRKYRLGIELFKLGNVVYESMNLKKIAEPYLQNATKESGLIAHLGILDGLNVVVIDKIWPPQYSDSIRMVSKVGGIVPAYCTGVGKTLLAYSSEEFSRRVLEKETFIKYSESTLSNIEEVMNELELVRKRGFATNYGEHEPYLECITYPIFNYNGKVIAALSLTGLKQIVEEMDKEKIHKILQNTTNIISEELGFSF